MTTAAVLPESLLPWEHAFTEHTQQLIKAVSRYLPQADVERIRHACIYGAHAHQHQSRSSGEPYIFHPIAVALILTEVQLDTPSIIGAILHDVVEDTEISVEEIQRTFGNDVATIVDGVSKLTQIRFSTKEEAKAENFRKMILAMTKDIRVIMVKLADRLHNMRTLDALAPYKKRRIAKETLEIYAPIAARLGMYALQVSLENLCFQNLYPYRYQILHHAIEKRHYRHQKILDQMQHRLNDQLKKNNIAARLSARTKHLWSIYKKLKEKGRIEDVFDIFALRVLVYSVDDCYRVLGIAHGLFKPIMGKFKDYIAIPKANGYQSLHTIVFGNNALPVEIQIRTRDMHVIAEAGAAAHWRYKAQYEGLSHNFLKTQQWLTDMQEMQSNTNSSTDFMETVKADLFGDEIYVFTPKGKIIELPKGASVVDFAYAIHSAIGNQCVSAKINNQLSPLRTQLKNGQTVEIVTASHARPNPAWLNFVVTAKARSAIHHYLNRLQQDEAIKVGQQLLEQALLARHSTLEQYTEKHLHQVAQSFNAVSIQHLYQDIGFGRRAVAVVVNRLMDDQEPVSSPNDDDNVSPIPSMMIKGSEGLVVSLGRCCMPLPGDPIMGFLTVGRGLVIHRDSCSHIKDYRKSPEKWVEVEWEKHITGDFPVSINLIVFNHRGTIASIAATLTELEVNIDDINSKIIDDHFGRVNLVIRVRNRHHLAQALKRLRALNSVQKISRQF